MITNLHVHKDQIEMPFLKHLDRQLAVRYNRGGMAKLLKNSDCQLLVHDVVL